jgi:hypothetical protein
MVSSALKHWPSTFRRALTKCPPPAVLEFPTLALRRTACNGLTRLAALTGSPNTQSVDRLFLRIGPKQEKPPCNRAAFPVCSLEISVGFCSMRSTLLCGVGGVQRGIAAETHALHFT